MSVTQHSIGIKQCVSGANRVHLAPRTFSSSSAPLLRQRTPLHASTASTTVSAEPSAPAFVKQLLAGAADLVCSSPNTISRRSSQVSSKPCTVSYADSSPTFKPMSAAARMAFAALEQDDEQEQQAALGALCLVTYSDSDDESGSMVEQRSRAVRAFSTLNALQDSSLCGTVSEDDAELAVGVMQTLCIVSYSEDDE